MLEPNEKQWCGDFLGNTSGLGWLGSYLLWRDDGNGILLRDGDVMVLVFALIALHRHAKLWYPRG